MTDVARPLVAVLEPGYADYATERRVLAAQNAVIAPVAASLEAAASLREMDPTAVLVRERRVSKAEIDACPRLKVIVRYGVGVDNIDLDAAAAQRIYVANVPDYGADQVVSDHAVALYLAVSRRIVGRDQDVRRGAWGLGQDRPIHGHQGKTIGLVGFGRIARAALAKFRALGFGRALAYDPYAEAEMAATDVTAVDVDTLCREADFISVHAPLTPETRHILNADRMALMKPEAVVVNVSRGGLIDETALADALRGGRLFGAGIDVLETEPPAPDSPLLHAPNTVLSDHGAWYSEQSVALLQTKAAEEIRRVLEGEAPHNWVNRWTG